LAYLPPVPLTLEGSSLLHQFFRFDWKAWRATPPGDRERIAAQAVETLRRFERAGRMRLSNLLSSRSWATKAT
jgi:peroxiredoxin